MFDPTNKKTKTNCVSYEEDSTNDTISTSYAHLLVLTNKLSLIVSLNAADTVSEDVPFSATVLILNLIGRPSSRPSTKA